MTNIVEAFKHMRSGGVAKFIPTGKLYVVDKTLAGIDIMQEIDNFNDIPIISVYHVEGEWELLV